MKATLQVKAQEVDGRWIATLSGPGSSQQFEYASEEEMQEGLRRALVKGAEMMFDGVVTAIRAKRKKVANGR